MLALQIRDSWRFADARRDTAITEAWMAPLAKPTAGELDRALAAVVDIDGASTTGRRV